MTQNSRRVLFPALLAGLLAVGCTAASAQERRPPENVEHAAEQARAADDLREQLAVAEQRAIEARAQFDAAALHRKAFESERVHLAARRRELDQAIARLSGDLAREREDKAEAHPQVAQLQAELTKLQAAAREVTNKADAMHAELEPILREVHSRNAAVERHARVTAELREKLDQMEAHAAGAGVPLPRHDPRRVRHDGSDAPFALGEAGPRPPRRGGAWPERTTEAEWERAARPRGPAVEDRLSSLERAVRELHEILERNGVPEHRRERAMGEVDRRRRGPPEAGERRHDPFDSDAGRAGEGRPGARGPGPRTLGGRGGPRPPDTDARRAEMDEMRAQMARLEKENAELRAHVEALMRERRER